MNKAGEWLLNVFFQGFEWSVKTSAKEIYLTFDDGPIPEVTEFVLDELKRVNAKATFFCVGENVQKNPGVFARILAEGHRVGNHTFNHLNSWKTDNDLYLQNMEQCQDILLAYGMEKTQKPLFRPPYGKLKLNILSKLSAKYRIIMWNMLTRDYDTNFAPEECLKGALQDTRPGSIVIFHDSLKAEKNMRFALTPFLDHFTANGFVFKTL